MSRIVLIAEQVNNELVFIKNIRELTGRSISEIRDSLKNKKPFFEGALGALSYSDNEDGDNEVLVTKILNHVNQNNDKIRLFIIDEDDEFELPDNLKDEITQEHWQNRLETCRETSRDFDELDEIECMIDCCDSWIKLIAPLKDQATSTCKDAARQFLDKYRDEEVFDEFEDLKNSECKVLIAQLYDKLDKFRFEEPLLQNPKWLEIVALAKNCCLALEAMITKF